MLRVGSVFVTVLALVCGQSTEVHQCISHTGPLPINTYIENCVTPPCLFPQLTDVVISIIFRTPRTTRSMTTLATAYLPLGLITIPWPHNLGDDAVTCNFLNNTYCPVMAGEVVQYTLSMHIESIFPVGTATTIEFRVVDDTSQQVLCIRVPIRILPPLEGRSASNSTLIN